MPQPTRFRNHRGDFVEAPAFSASDAKNSFGRLLDVVERSGMVTITRHDEPKAMLLSMDEYRALAGGRESALDVMTGEFDTMLARIRAPGARDAMQSAFDTRAREIKPRVADAVAPDPARLQARLELQRKLEQQRSRHMRLAVDLVVDEQAAARMVAKARERVELWRSKRSCSPLYIERWSEILALPPRSMAKAMASLGEWEDAMFQNSPWSWAWN